MGRRNPFGPLVGAITRAARAAERDRQRQYRQRVAQARYEQREQDRIEKQYWQQQQYDLRESERQERQKEREQARLAKEELANEKARQKAYFEGRQEEAAALNAVLEERLIKLSKVLVEALRKDHRLSDIDSLRRNKPYKAFEYPERLQPSLRPELPSVPSLSFIKKLVPGSVKKHQVAMSVARSQHVAAVTEFELREAEKRKKIEQLYAVYQENKNVYEQDIERHNACLDGLKENYPRKRPEAIVAYCEFVLKQSVRNLKSDPYKFRMAYSSESGELVIEQELPTIDEVPDVVEYRYIKSRDDLSSKPRKSVDIKDIYTDHISALTLRTLYVLFQSDMVDALRLITFNGILDTHSRSTGKPQRIPVVSVRATKEEFESINLKKVDKILCLRQLGAQVSPHPEELLAVKPIVHFDMVDKRFVDQSNLLDALNDTPNLMDLTPTEFEVLVANLFGQMGLDTKLTRSTRDGGVDAIAFDSRPILGGKVVIQAKRYSNTVGVSAVRDLYGTMLNEGANKGILVSTSGYGPDAYNFSKDKPIELIDGQGLLYLLREHANTDARIVFNKL